jgi:hypothetical protein
MTLRPTAPLRVLSALLPALLVTPAFAVCPGDCPVKGGGSPTTDCIVEFDGFVFNHPPTKLKELRCTDGDGSCDADGQANGACRVDISVCLNNTDPDLPMCTPSDVAVFTVKNKPIGHPKFDPQLQALQDGVTALGLPETASVCTMAMPVNVPLKVTNSGFKKGKKTIITTAQNGGVGKDKDKIKLTCNPSTTFPAPGTQYALAKVITQPAELIEGPLARGRVGDYLLANDKIQVVIQKPGRVMFGIGPYGGNIIDGELQRADGSEHDSFEEWSPGINLENTANHTSITVLNDGSNNLPAVIRATGVDDLLDFVNPSSVVAGFGGTFPASADDTDLPVTVQTDYTLEAGKSYVKVDTKLTNTDTVNPLDIFFSDYLNGSGQVELFQTGYGFGEPLVTHPRCANSGPNNMNYPCTAGMCDICNIVAYSGEDLARNVSYGYIHTINGSTSFSTSGVTVPVLGQQVVTALIGAAIPNFHMDPAPGAGSSITITRYFAIGDGSVASIETIRNEIQGITRGTLTGVVTDSNGPVADADVAVVRTAYTPSLPNNVINHFRTAADGSYSGTLPVANYTVRVNKDGRLFGAPDPAPVSITAGGTTTQNFTLPTPGRLQVSVVDENNDPIPAKIQLVGFDPSPDTLNQQDIGLGFVATTGMFGANVSDHDGLAYGIAGVFFADRNGVTTPAAVEMEPGNYQVVVSHGPRYSAYTQNVTINAGATTGVSAQIARVIDTPGFIAGDFHVHAINSPDCETTNEERVATMLAEGMDFFTPSDHDIRIDFTPVIAKMGVGDLIATAQSAEITTFDYGHFNSWPVTHDPNQVNGGGVDWGRAGVAPGLDFPSLGSYNLSPEEIIDTAHADPLDNLIQINHFRSAFGIDGLDVDTAEGGTGPPTSHVDPALRRLAGTPSTNLYDDGYDALEVWIGTDGRSGDLTTFVGQNLGDWFNLLNQGELHTGVADSDTHQRRTTQINARSYVASTVTNPALLSGEAENLAANVVAGKLTGTNSAFVTVNVTTTMGTAGLGVADSTLVQSNDTNATVNVTVKSPTWAEFDKVQIFVNNAQQPFDHDADAGTRMLYRVYNNGVCDLATGCIEKVAGTHFNITTENTLGGQYYQGIVSHNLTGLTDDVWIVVLVRGTDGVSKPLFPVIPNSIKQSTNSTLANLTDGNLGEDGVMTLAFTNPLYVSVDGDADFDPPGVLLVAP